MTFLPLWLYLVWERNCKTSWVWWPAGRLSSRLVPVAWNRWGFELPGKNKKKQKTTENICDQGDNDHLHQAPGAPQMLYPVESTELVCSVFLWKLNVNSTVHRHWHWVAVIYVCVYAYVPYISDLLAGSFVCLQARQDVFRVLEDCIHLVPHLALSFCRLCI